MLWLLLSILGIPDAWDAQDSSQDARVAQDAWDAQDSNATQGQQFLRCLFSLGPLSLSPSSSLAGCRFRL